MSMEKTAYIKIIGLDLLNEEFKNLVCNINKELKLNLTEKPLDYVYGFQDDNVGLRINYVKSKKKIEVVSFYNSFIDLKPLIEVSKNILKMNFHFLAFALSFGAIYKDFPLVNCKFRLPEFKENELKYKLNTEIHNLENGEIYLSTNFHFYNFDKYNLEPKEVVQKEILTKLEELYNTFQESIGG